MQNLIGKAPGTAGFQKASISDINSQHSNYSFTSSYEGRGNYDNLGHIGIDWVALAAAEAELGKDFVDELLGDLLNDPEVRGSSEFRYLQAGIGRHYQNRAAANALNYYAPSGAIKAGVGVLSHASRSIGRRVAALRQASIVASNARRGTIQQTSLSKAL